MTNTDEGQGASLEDASGPGEEQGSRLHDDSQALLDALSRRARRLGRRIRRTKEPPVRILKLMD